MSDNVNHPKHYELLEGVEAKDIIKALLGDNYIDYCYGNVIKYILRCTKKNNMIEDLEKSKVYIDWIIEELNNKGVDNVKYK